MLRKEQLQNWLQSLHPDQTATLTFAAADAGKRRYFRATWPDGTHQIVMDAPPEDNALQTYLAVRDLFASVNVPQIIATNLKEGFILLEDFGDITYLSALLHDEQEFVHRHLLLEAIDTLLEIQKLSKPNILPPFDHTVMMREVSLLPEWYCAYELGITLTPAQQQWWESGIQTLLSSLITQPNVFMHRDFIVRNLMLTPGRPGVLDFQDAAYGPISYDIVSLLRDAFIEWDEAFVLDIVIRYWEKARAADLPVPLEFDQFYSMLEWMGVQRHLKIVGLFSRLHHRDGKSHYRAEIPRFLRYLQRATRRYQPLAPIYQFLQSLPRAESADDISITLSYTNTRRAL